MRRTAFAHLNNRADAEDVCQDAFFQCWRRIGECRTPSRVAAWIAAIVRNAAHYRRDFLRVREAEPMHVASHVATPRRPDVDAERGELRSRLRAAIAQLTPTAREVLLLHDLEGWKHAEIASRLDIGETMSRRHLSDGRRRLRELLGDLPTLEVDRD